MDIAAAFSSVDIFCELAPRGAERMGARATAVILAAGDTSNALETGDAVLFIVSGKVRASALAHGRIGFEDLGPGDTQGLVEAVAGAPVPPCALLALDATEAFALPSDAVLAALRSGVAPAFAMARRLAVKLAAREAADDPLQKVYRDILRTARPVGESRWTLDPMPRHRDLAALAGVNEADAAAAIAHLVRIGVARRRYPALDIEDREALRALAG